MKLLSFSRAHRYLTWFAALALLSAAPARSETAPTDGTPWTAQAFSVESGMLWEVGINTPLSYRLVPTQLSWRSREVLGWALPNGGRLVVRHRLTLLGTWVQQGPESIYLAVAGSPSIELWNPRGTWAVVGGAGGGFGLIDSRHTPGGQGQDFTLNWFARLGVEHEIGRGRSVMAGIMFQHMSNGGMTKPNPGIDAFGFSVGYSWRR